MRCKYSSEYSIDQPFSSDIEIELISDESMPHLVTVNYIPYKPCQTMMHVTLHGEQISGGPFFLDIKEATFGTPTLLSILPYALVPSKFRVSGAGLSLAIVGERTSFDISIEGEHAGGTLLNLDFKDSQGNPSQARSPLI